MRIPFRFLLAVAAAGTTACATRPPSAAPKPKVADEHPLAGLVAQRIVVTPTFAMSVASELDWGSHIGRHRDVLAAIDTAIAGVLDDRGVKSHWVFPPALVRSYQTNPTYAADPYALGYEPLRASTFTVGSRLPEPLASQLRTIAALSDGRYILAPVELRFERVGSTGTTARAVLRVILLDSRLSESRWIGEVKSDTASAYSPALIASVATRFADLITSP